MKLIVRRTGGFAGLKLTITVDTGTLSADDQSQLKSLLARCSFLSLPSSIKSPSRQPDRFSYHLTLDDGQQTKVVEIDESELKGNLKELIQFVMKKKP